MTDTQALALDKFNTALGHAAGEYDRETQGLMSEVPVELDAVVVAVVEYALRNEDMTAADVLDLDRAHAREAVRSFLDAG